MNKSRLMSAVCVLICTLISGSAGAVAVNTLPVALDTTVATDQDVPLDIDVNDVATDPDGDLLTFWDFDAITAVGGTVVANGANTVLTYTPAANFFGTDSFHFTVSDGIDISNVATITVTVNSVIPIPPAVWLFGSGLLGLIGVAKRKAV